jgi:hypothetical protein
MLNLTPEKAIMNQSLLFYWQLATGNWQLATGN